MDEAGNSIATSRVLSVAHLRARLSEIAPPSTWRVVAAFAAALLSVCVTSGGLFFYAPEIQAAVLAGVCAALVAPTLASATGVAVTATALGLMIGPANLLVPARANAAAIAVAVLAGLLAGLVAMVARVVAKRVPEAGMWLMWGIIALLVANVWGSAIHVARATQVFDGGATFASPFKVLSGEVALTSGGDEGDAYAYLQVLKAVKGGVPFYTAWHDEQGPNRLPGASAGNSVFTYHLPAIFWFWAALPGTPVSVVYAYLVLVTLAVGSVPIAVRGTVRAPLAIPGAAAVAAYLFMFGGSLLVLEGEPWAGALGVLALAAWARSSASGRWRAWTIAAVVLAVLAALVREPAVFIPVSGLATALYVRDDQRRFRVWSWTVGLLAFAGLYVAHYLNVRPLLSGPSIGAVVRFTGLGTIVSALTRGAPALGATGALPVMLACVGFLGILPLTAPRTRMFAGAAIVSTLLAFMVVNNGARDLASGASVNYWGPVIVPMIYACIPAWFAFIPGMAPGARVGATGGERGEPSA